MEQSYNMRNSSVSTGNIKNYEVLDCNEQKEETIMSKHKSNNFITQYDIVTSCNC